MLEEQKEYSNLLHINPIVASNPQNINPEVELVTHIPEVKPPMIM